MNISLLSKDIHKERLWPLITTGDILKDMKFNISILNLYLHIVFIKVSTRETVAMIDYYDLSDYEIITIV